MSVATISSKYQMAIPKSIRDLVGLQVGQKVRIIPHGKSFEVVPVEPMINLQGLLKGMNPDFEREEDRIV